MLAFVYLLTGTSAFVLVGAESQILWVGTLA